MNYSRVVWSLFCSVRVYKSLHFLPILLVKLGFRLSMFQFFVFLFLYLRSFALSFEFNVLIDLITWYSQSGNKINHVLFKFVFTLFRSSHRRCFIKKAVLKNFAIFTWKHLCWVYLRTAGSVYSKDLWKYKLCHKKHASSEVLSL